MGGTSNGAHEASSRLWENLIGRSRAFWQAHFGDLCAHFPEQLAEVDVDLFCRAVNRVQPSLIRVEADEVTYNLHIMLRVEIEMELLDGTLGVMAFTTSWMQFLWPLVSQSSQGNFTLPVGLSLMGQGSLYEVNYQLWMASAVMAVIPPLVFFLILENAYMRGLETLSGLRG